MGLFSSKPPREPKPPRERGPSRIPQQVTRLVVVFAIGIAAFIAARKTLVPKTFGDLGHYRAAALTDITALERKYAGREECVTCHEEEVATHSRARHQTVACETCHGPAAEHIASGGDVKPIVPRERDFCPRCHGYDLARPTGFPQIDPVTHNPVKPCVECHKPHEPAPPNVPATCGACHGEIARVKAVSPHTDLPCTRCHQADDIHKDTPRLSRPTKPTSREFCGGCHAKEASSPPTIPRIDLASHGGRYLCWQCHYPHDPEVR